MKNYWQTKSISLGVVKRNTSRIVLFQALPNIPRIVNIVPGCQCTNPIYDNNLKVLSVKYSAGDIPPQVNGNQPIMKYITIVYEDNTVDTLEITGVKIR